jgi:hypothetical protein
MKRTLLALLGLFLSLGVIYYKCQPTVVIESHVLDMEAYSTTTDNVAEDSDSLQIKYNVVSITCNTYTQEELELLAHAINAEQGIEYEDEEITNKLQIYAGQVILNRVAQHYMGATTIEEVLYTPGQYACVSDCSWDNPISARAYYNASLLLIGAPYWEIYDIPQMPDNVIYQAEFTQGEGTWLKLKDTYFCYE